MSLAVRNEHNAFADHAKFSPLHDNGGTCINANSEHFGPRRNFRAKFVLDMPFDNVRINRGVR